MVIPPLHISQGDCLHVLEYGEPECVDLILTSPPYANARKSSYGGIKEKDFVEWFLPRSERFFEKLKPSGSFVLNIKEGCVRGERSTYVMELLLALRKQGWIWKDEYVWVKKNPMPGKWKGRLSDGWERIYHFTKTSDIKFCPDNVMVPASYWTLERAGRVTEGDEEQAESKTGSGFSTLSRTSRRVRKTMSRFTTTPAVDLEGRIKVYPSNVIIAPSVSTNKGHPAVFPRQIPIFFINLLTEEGDLVLDPFAGSGMTAVQALKLGRKAAAIEVVEEYVKLIWRNTSEVAPTLFGGG